MSKSTNTHLNSNYDCIIVGAGITGLIAARDLAKKLVKVLLIEASDRLGGRIFDDFGTFQCKSNSNNEAEGFSSSQNLPNKASMEEKASSYSSSSSPYCISFGANKFYPSNNEYLMNELKRYKLQMKEEKYHKTFIQIKEHHVITLYELFHRIQRNPYYQAIVKDLNDLSILIDPLHAPFDYDSTGDYYNSFEGLSGSAASSISSGSLAAQQKYYELFKKNILHSDLYHQYDIRFYDYLQNHTIFEKIIPQTEEEKHFLEEKDFIIEFFLLNVTILFEIDYMEVSLLMLLNLINLFYFKFENILSFNFHSYHTIDHHQGFHALLEGIFMEFIEAGGQYLFNTPLVSVYQNIHYYQASLSNYYEGGSSNAYNLQSTNTPYYPKTRPTTTIASTGENLTLPDIAPTDLQPVRVKTAYPITNTFLQLPADITNSICKLANGEMYQCKQIILTVPINCLSSIQFYPNLSVVFQRAIERCYPSNSTNLMQMYGICSNHVREKEDLPENITNRSNITNRVNRILALPSAEAVRFQHNVFQSFVHHRELYLSSESDDKEVKERIDDYTLVSIHGIRRSVVERKQESFELMHPEIEKLSKHSLICHDFVADPFIRTNWFHMRQGTRNLYLRMCIEAIAPWKYCKQNNRSEDNEDGGIDNTLQVEPPGTIPVVPIDNMSLYITNADLSPHWTGWIEGGIYMGKRAAEILYPRIINQPVATNFAKKNDRVNRSRFSSR